MNILAKIKKAGLVGRGGACFPVDKKWQMVKKAKEELKYVVCNAAEGEPGVKKDGYILDKHPEKVIDGMRLAINFLFSGKPKDRENIKAYIYLNPAYYKKLKNKLNKIIGILPIKIFRKPPQAGYIGGEESAALNAIEGQRIEPRLRPPFPTTNGLWNCPTIINNVETFYNISLLNEGNYKNERFYTIGGDCIFGGVYNLSENLSIENILKKTKNYPDFPFFVQIGGDASGEVLNSGQLKRKVTGAASITIYSKDKHKAEDVLKNWLKFFVNQSCGKCTPCREGIYRMQQITKVSNPNWELFFDLLNNLSETAICGLGCALPVPVISFFNNVLNPIKKNKKLEYKK